MKTIEDYEDELVRNQHRCTCKKCGKLFIYEPDDVWWDEKGYGYSTKLVQHKDCGCINVVEHVEDYGFSRLNTDVRLYF